jgi:uncharacterized protein YjiS (DUF1127 family)
MLSQGQDGQESAMSNRLLTGEILRLQSSDWLAASLHPMQNRLSWASVRAGWRRYRSRQSIVGLDSHLLKDIGVSFAEAEAEANKPFWRE